MSRRAGRQTPLRLTPMAGAEYLGAGGRLAGGPAEELVAAGYAGEIAHGPRLAHALSQADMAHAVALAESGSLPAEDAAPLCRGLLELDAIDPAEFPWRPDARRRLQLARGRADRSCGPAGRRLAERRAAPARGLPRGPAPRGPRGRGRAPRRARSPGRGARAEGGGHGRRPGRRLHLSPAGAAHHRGPPAPGLRGAGPPRRPAAAGRARRARTLRGRRRRQRRVPLAGRHASAWPSCSDARAWSFTPRTRRGRPTSTSSSSRPWRWPPPT